MKKLILISLLIISTSLLFTGCNTPDSATQIGGNSQITIDLNKAVDNVDSFFEGLVDKVTSPVK